MFRKPQTRVEPRPGAPGTGGKHEALLTVRSRPKPFFLDRRFLRAVIPAVALAVTGLVALGVHHNLLLPFGRLVVLEGKMGANADFFEDEQVREILLRNHIRVHVTPMGSRDAVTADLNSTDFVLPSGQPTAVLLNDRLAKHEGRDKGLGEAVRHQLFVSPIVLATFRDYAETLERARVATPQPSQGSNQPYYYDLDVKKFFELTRGEKTWDQLGGPSNGNQILARTPNVCSANSAATYLGLVAYVTLGHVPKPGKEEIDLINDIKPLLRAQGMPVVKSEIYFTPEGRRITPIIVMYEHQYLAHQLRFTEEHKTLDHERVLLYPRPGFDTESQFISLTPRGEELGKLLDSDRDLRRRATEIGFRVYDPSGVNPSKRLPKVLSEHEVPLPLDTIDTTARLPDATQLERMITMVGECPPIR